MKVYLQGKSGEPMEAPQEVRGVVRNNVGRGSWRKVTPTRDRDQTLEDYSVLYDYPHCCIRAHRHGPGR